MSMSPFLALFLYSIFFLFTRALDKTSESRRKSLFFFSFLICVFIVGVRNPIYWIDSGVYDRSFHETTNTLSTFSFDDYFYGYTEKGYYLLCVIAKTIADSTFVYFTFIAFLSLSFIFYSLDRYSPLPFLGLCVYIAHFMMARDMNQMRAGVAIAIVVAATALATRRQVLLYIAVCLLASTLHTSVLLAMPLVLMSFFPFKKKHIFIGILLSFLVAGFFGDTIRAVLPTIDFVRELATSYVEEDSEKAWSNDLANPMIYFQTFVLLAYTLWEGKLSKMTPHYYTIRNAYFYSTVLLIVLCQYGIVAGRTSTIFATYEIVILPLFVKATSRQYRFFPFLLILVAMSIFFLRNFR